MLLVVLVLGNAALLSALALRPAAQDPYGPPRAAAAMAPAPSADVVGEGSAAPAPEVPAAPPVLAVYGDGYAAGNASGGLGPAGWPAKVAAQTGSALALHAVSQAGYASVGVSGQNLLQVVQGNPVPAAAVTLLFGSRNDADRSLAEIGTNAQSAIAAVQAQAPGTALVVIGPVWDDGDVPAGILAARDAVQAAAEAAGVGFVDPVADGWFADQSGLIAPDGISPDDDGHTYLARLISPVVDAALAGRAGQ